MSREPTVYVVDDDAAVRDALRCVMESVCLAVQTCASCEEFLEIHDEETPGCLVLDVRLPGMSGFELQEKLRADGLEIPIVMVTGYGDISMAVRAMANGAVDYITKPFNDQVLLDRVRLALKRDNELRRRRADLERIEIRYDTLTPREREVMWLVIAGKANKVIAADLDLSCKTIEGHRASVMEKMQAESLATLVRLGLALEHSGVIPEVPTGNRLYMSPLS
ncbi:MAG: response regulator transcription factor [Phycisphaerae bacterium]|nr:response regulator transcription factor [Phycisphaerae bacterium]